MSALTVDNRHQKTLSLSALDDLTSRPAGPETPSKFRQKFASISAKSKRFLSIRKSATKERKDLSTISRSTTPSCVSSSSGADEGNDTPPTTVTNPFALIPIATRKAQSEGFGQRTGAHRGDTTRLETPNHDSAAAQTVPEPESPTVNVAQRRAKSCGVGVQSSDVRVGEQDQKVRPFTIDGAQLSYATSMEALSRDFAESVFPESPLPGTDIPKSEIDIPFPAAIPVSYIRERSPGAYPFGDSAFISVAPVVNAASADRAVKVESPEISLALESAEADILGNRPTTSWLHMAKTVQRAAQHLSDDEDLSPVVLFQTLGPIILLLYGIAAGVLLKQYHTELGATLGLTGATKHGAMFAILVVGAIGTLITLKVSILVLSKLLRTFCEMDMETAFHRGECIDAEGKRVGESDLVLGSFLLASPSSPVVA